MSVFHNNALIGAGGGAVAAAAPDTGRSLRFNNDDSAHLSKTFSSAGNRKTWTWAAWVKLTTASGGNNLFAAYNNSFTIDNFIQFYIEGNAGKFSAYGTALLWESEEVFRDPSAWYHFVIAFDTTQSTADDRLKVYVNGQQITKASGNGFSQNVNYAINNNIPHRIGTHTGGSEFFDGYMTDIYFIDGSQLSPTSFGAFDSNGVWQKADYSGTFGTNGFHLLDFANESTLGHDSSGNDNDFTTSGLSTSAGAGHDTLFDFPANGSGTDTGAGGEVNGNYCTFNPLAKGSAITLSNGNLDFSITATQASVLGTIGLSSGKWYFELEVTTRGGIIPGITKDTINLDSDYVGETADSYGYFGGDGNVYNNNSGSGGYASFTDGDIIGIAFDADNGKLYFSKNGTYVNSGNPAAGTGAAFTGISGTYFPAVGGGTLGACAGVFNFGARAFNTTAPSGFKAICTTNLATPTIADGSDYFDIQLYTGNGASTPGGSGSTQDFSNFAFAPSWVWIKDRTQSGHNHNLVDIVRGAPNLLLSDDTNAEITNSTDGFTGFTSDGFTLGDNGEGTQSLELNKNANSYVAWAWDAGSSTASNTDGSITSQVRASQTAGISIVTYSGTGSNATVGHGLNAQVEFLITKDRSNANSWHVQHSATGNTKALFLNGNGAAVANGAYWNNTTPTSSVFTVGTADGMNGSGSNYVAYCFAPVAGYSSVGSYTGSSTLPFVQTGFRPRFLLIKGSTVASGWIIYDTARDPFNVSDHRLQANTNGAESTNDANLNIDILSNGFKLRNTDSDSNGSGETYVYLAIAENPFQANGGLAR